MNIDAFSGGLGLSCRKYRLKFYPSFTGFSSLMNNVYSQLCIKDRHFCRMIPLEAFRYYGSCLFWLRVLRLKLLFHDVCTSAEEELLCAFGDRKLKLTVPEPIFVGLKAIGRFTTKAGVELRPEFPELPTECTEDIPGSYGVIDEDNHHWYEDYPVVGPAYEALIRRVSTKNSGDYQTYESVFAPHGLAVNVNLQGYDKLRPARGDEWSFLCDLDDSESGFQNIKNSGISHNIMLSISDFLKKNHAFRNFCFSQLTETGLVAQQIEAHPVFENYKLCRAANSCVEMRSFSKESEAMVGISIVYGLNLWKENLKVSEPWEQVSPWSSVTFTPDNQPSEKWIAERNRYRNMPSCFQGGNFTSCYEEMENYRCDVVHKLVRR